MFHRDDSNTAYFFMAEMSKAGSAATLRHSESLKPKIIAVFIVVVVVVVVYRLIRLD
jgi:hypothetical protein